VRVARADSQLQISVSDSGAGISPDFLAFVFDRFSQASTSSKRRYGGIGLGLAIVKHLAELHGGDVKAESPGEGLGATFTVTLPLNAAHRDTNHSVQIPSIAEDVALAGETALEGLRIIVVDDEQDARDLVARILVAAGADVRSCASAAEALEAIDRWQPSVLVSDVSMPDEDGYSLVRKLRELAPNRGGDIPAVALTGYARTEDRTRALVAGFQMHVPKPVEATELIMVVASLAGRAGKLKIFGN